MRLPIAVRTNWVARGAALLALITSGCGNREPVQQPAAEVSAGKRTETVPAQNTSPIASKNETPPANDSQPAVPTATRPAPSASESPPATIPPTSSEVAAADTPAQPDKQKVEQKKPKDYEPMFEGWPKPKLVLIFSGQQQGYLEPCGCAGLENQKGGLSRRHTFLKSLIERGWPVATFDVGAQVRRFGKESELQFQTTVEGLKGMDYRAVTFGLDDLRLVSPEVLTLALAGLQDSKLRFVAANVTLQDVDESLLPKFIVFDAGGLKIGVTGILGDRFRKQLSNDGVRVSDPEAALAQVVPKLQEQKCDLLVLLSHATIDSEKRSVPGETIDLAKRFPVFNFVVTPIGPTEPPHESTIIEGTSCQLIEVGQKAEYAVAVGLFDDPKQRTRYQSVQLDDRYKDSPEMHLLKIVLQDQIRELGFEGLGITPASYAERQPPANLPENALSRTLKFVGTHTCADCHTKAAAKFETTGHAHATDTLTHLDPPRQFDPECLSCHVTGWNPQQFVPFPSGYASLEKTPLLVGNGCENCHGPGDAHAAAEAGDLTLTDQQRDALRAQMRLPLAKAVDTCVQCHDLDNSPAFSKPDLETGFKTYWPKVEHHGKD